MNLTVMLMIVTTAFLIAFDVWVIMKRGKYESISAHVIRGSKKFPLIVLAFGILLGHLFWSMDSFDSLPKEEIIKKCQEYTK